MKKTLLLLLFGVFLSGCAALKESEFTEHSALYSTWDHVKYSWWGYANPTQETLKESQGQKWWGIPTPK